VSLLDTYLSLDSTGDGDHGHVCPDCDRREPCALHITACPEPELTPCVECAAPIGYAVHCCDCQHYWSDDQPTHAAAEQVAGEHDDTYHHGTPTAVVNPVRIPTA